MVIYHPVSTAPPISPRSSTLSVAIAPSTVLYCPSAYSSADPLIPGSSIALAANTTAINVNAGCVRCAVRCVLTSTIPHPRSAYASSIFVRSTRYTAIAMSRSVKMSWSCVGYVSSRCVMSVAKLKTLMSIPAKNSAMNGVIFHGFLSVCLS